MFIAIRSFFCFLEESFFKEQKGSDSMNYVKIHSTEITLEQCEELYKKLGIKAEHSTKNNCIILSKEEN